MSVSFFFLLCYCIFLVNSIIYCLIFTIWVASITVYESNLLASVQQSIGPYEVGFNGSLQFFADALKLLANGILILTNWARLEIIVTAIVSIFLVYLFWPQLYLGFNCLMVDIEYNIVYIIILSCLLAYSVINIGVVSSNNFALIASLRFSLTIMNGELLLGFLWTFVVGFLESASFGVLKIIGYDNIIYFIFSPVTVVLILCFCIETGSTPLDFGESESELIAGYITELSGFFFTLFYLGEYFHLITLSNAYAIVLFSFI